MRNRKHIDDLDYLAELGFAAVPTTSAELRRLKRRVRRRIGWSKLLLTVALSVLLGAGLATALIFRFHAPKNVLATGAAHTVQPKRLVPRGLQAPTFLLDTLQVQGDNFVKPRAALSAASLSATSAGDLTDTLQVEQLDTRTGFDWPSQPLTEQRLKFIINSPVVYIHDLKVSDYRNLYFKKNQFVRLGQQGVPASQAVPEGAAGSRLKQEATWYLHEELALAMRDFSKARYDEAQARLLDIERYNGSDINCNFYIGLCCYHRKRYAKAVERLTACIEDANNAFLQEAMYYKALGLLELGQRDEARKLLKRIETEGEFYAAKATALLQGL